MYLRIEEFTHNFQYSSTIVNKLHKRMKSLHSDSVDVKICLVCNKSEAKYKCPTCKLRYCSVPCCKSHRMNSDNCIPNTSDTSRRHMELISNVEISTNSTEQHELQLNATQIQKLSSSLYIKDMIQSKRLREDLIKIDSGNDRLNILRLMRLKNTELNEFFVRLMEEISDDVV